jgi:hypothetical protein
MIVDLLRTNDTALTSTVAINRDIGLQAICRTSRASNCCILRGRIGFHACFIRGWLRVARVELNEREAHGRGVASPFEGLCAHFGLTSSRGPVPSTPVTLTEFTQPGNYLAELCWPWGVALRLARGIDRVTLLKMLAALRETLSGEAVPC